jgi:hypothetical protein
MLVITSLSPTSVGFSLRSLVLGFCPFFLIFVWFGLWGSYPNQAFFGNGNVQESFFRSLWGTYGPIFFPLFVEFFHFWK